jgi:hypothetical protein
MEECLKEEEPGVVDANANKGKGDNERGVIYTDDDRQ